MVFIIDGSEFGHECITLMISLTYGKRALPITWLVVTRRVQSKGCKGHLPERLHLDLLSQLQAILPQDAQANFLGDGEFDGLSFKRLYSRSIFAISLGQPRTPSCTMTIVSLDLAALRNDWLKVIHRSYRCDWSLFRLGLALLDHFLNADLPIPVSFTLVESKCVR